MARSNPSSFQSDSASSLSSQRDLLLRLFPEVTGVSREADDHDRWVEDFAKAAKAAIEPKVEAPTVDVDSLQSENKTLQEQKSHYQDVLAQTVS